MEIINLDYLENTPLSTQLSRLTGYGWHTGNYVNEDGKQATSNPLNVITNVHTGQKFRLPKKQSKVIDYFSKSWEYKMQLLESHTVIQISEETFDFLLECVPPVRMSGGAFLAGEAITHIGNTPFFACCFRVDSKYFLGYHTVKSFEEKDYLNEYNEHLETHDLF